MPSSTSSSSSSSKSFRRRACCSSLFFFCHILNRKTENAAPATRPRHIMTILIPIMLPWVSCLSAFFTSLEFDGSSAKPSKTQKLLNSLLREEITLCFIVGETKENKRNWNYVCLWGKLRKRKEINILITCFTLFWFLKCETHLITLHRVEVFVFSGRPK